MNYEVDKIYAYLGLLKKRVNVPIKSTISIMRVIFFHFFQISNGQLITKTDFFIFFWQCSPTFSIGFIQWLPITVEKRLQLKVEFTSR